jgi:diacylglycerol kinase family enzyme
MSLIVLNLNRSLVYPFACATFTAVVSSRGTRRWNRSRASRYARGFLQSDSRFVVREIEPAAIPNAVRREVDRGTARILICGGDGTIAAAVGAAARTRLEVAVFPGGTLTS